MGMRSLPVIVIGDNVSVASTPKPLTRRWRASVAARGDGGCVLPHLSLLFTLLLLPRLPQSRLLCA